MNEFPQMSSYCFQQFVRFKKGLNNANYDGKLGQIGGRLISASAKKIADDFFQRLSKELSGESSELDDGSVEPVA